MSPAAGRGTLAAPLPPRGRHLARGAAGSGGEMGFIPPCGARPQPVPVTRRSDSTRQTPLGGVFVVKRLLLKSRFFKLTDFMIYMRGEITKQGAMCLLNKPCAFW